MQRRYFFPRFDLPRIALVVAIGLASVALVRLLPFLQLTENLLYDLRLTLMTSRGEQSPHIVIVGITEETLVRMPYRAPVNRQFLAQLVTDLQKKGAGIVALDILFDQPTEAQLDAQLKQVLETATIPVIVASAGTENRLLPSQSEFLRAFTANLVTGNATVFRDSLDGVVRSLPIRFETADGPETGLAARIVEAAGYDLPARDRTHIDYRLARGEELSRFPVYPAHNAGFLPAEWIDGKIVMIGAELELEDRHATPFSRVLALKRGVSGLQIQAHAVSQLIEGRSIIVPGLAWAVLLSLAWAVFGQAGASGKYGILLQCLSMAAWLALLWLVAGYLFQANRVMIELMSPTIALLLSGLLSILRQWKTEGEERRFIQGAFGKYLSPDYVDRLVENPEWLSVGGERREMTFLFTDLEGFTPLTEKLDADRLVALLNEYLDGSCEIVTRHGGMVANIVGDALYVIFNAPLIQDGHALRAVQAALELDRFCVDFQARKKAEGIELGVTRIGINTGPGVIGNFGGSRRLEYTAMGDGINIAARLESVNKHLGTRICVSESAVALCPGIEFRPVGRLVLKGKQQGVLTFTPVGGSDSGSIAAYRQAYRRMSNREPGAEAGFRELLETSPDDPLARFHAKRLGDGHEGDLIVMESK